MTPAPYFARFGRYEIIRKLGRSMSDVYLALDPEANRRVVLKIVEQSHDPNTQLVVDAERRGAAIQQQLHKIDPRILEIYEYGEQNGCFFVTMQYAEGRSLAEMLHNSARLDPKTAARYAAEICSQLASLHSFQADVDGHKRAVIHGDIKPSNVQIGPEGQVWLLDFGIAKAITATRNLTQHNLGSPAYCSPERVKTGSVDPRADLWAAGVCLYEMLAGLRPYQAQTTRKLENLIQSGRPPRALPDTCPPALKAIVWKALAADSNRRYSSAAAFERDLRAFLDGRRSVAEGETEPAWETNATVEKAKPGAPVLVRDRSELWLHVAKRVSEWTTMAWSLLAGVVVGLLCFIAASYGYRYWKASAALAEPGDVEAAWAAYRSADTEFAKWGRFSPVRRHRERLAADLVSTADAVIDGYRNGAEPSAERFDWSKARTALSHALELQPASAELKGKLALCDGYLALGSPRRAQDLFERAAALLPKSPDPHLGLARVAIYGFHNIGYGIAELDTAERLGYKLGAREREQQADGYLYRAEQQLHQRRWSPAAARDLERARNLYEPIEGFSRVSDSLARLERDEASADLLRAASERAKKSRTRAVRKKPRYRRWG